MRKNPFGDRQRKLRCAHCWHVVLSRFNMTMNLICFNFSDASTTLILNTRSYAVLADVSNGVPLIYLPWKYGKSHSTNAATTSLDRNELLLERRDKPRAGHPVDYASLSRYRPPQKIYSPSPPSPPPPVLATVDGRLQTCPQTRWHGTVRSTALNQSSPGAIIVPRTIMYYGPWPSECGTYEDPRNKYNKGRGCDGGESIRDRRWRLRAILMGFA